MRTLSLVVFLFVGALLIYATQHLPPAGTTDAPAYTRVAEHYTLHAYEDMHTPNVVTAILADYRGFDTLGEALVVFIAGVGTMLILGRDQGSDE